MDIHEYERNNKNQQINVLTQRQILEQGRTRISEKQTMRFEINRLFSYDNKQILDGQDHPSANAYNVPDLMNEINDLKVENYIVSPKSIDRILIDNNYNGMSCDTSNKLRPTTYQFQLDKQTSFYQIQQPNIDCSHSQGNLNDKLKNSAEQYNGDRSSFIKNQSYNQSLLDHKQDGVYFSNFEQNEKPQAKNVNINSHIEPIPKGIEFLVLKNVKKFINKMKKQSRSILFKQLSKPQFKIINDVSSNYDYYMENGFFNLNISSIKQSLLAYLFQKFLQTQTLKDITIIILFVLSTYSQNGSIYELFNFIVFLKYTDVGNKLEELESKFRLNDRASNWLKLIKLELSIFLIAHVACCIYLKIGLEETHAGDYSWLKNYKLIEQPTQIQYLNSLYYCLITMTTIGYGDITPQTIPEKCFILVVSVLACGIFAYTFSQISEIVKDQEKKKKEFSRNMQMVNREMNKKGMSIPLQHKVRKYFEHLQKLEEKRSFLQDEMFEKLPKTLKEEVLLDTNKQIIAKHYIFSKLSYECIRQIALLIRQKNYLPGEVIFYENDVDENLYFIWSGEVNLSKQYSPKDQNNQDTTLTTLKKRDFFGHIGFFIDNPNPYTSQAKSFVNLSYIRRQDFLSVLEKFPLDYEKYSYYKDNVSLYHQVSILEKKCISCGDYNHFLHMCPSVHLVTSAGRFIQNKQSIMKNSDQIIGITRKNKKFNALNSAEILSINIAEYWCMKAEDDNSSILSDIQDVIQLKADMENQNQVTNHISEQDSCDSDENKSPDSTFKKQTHTYYSRDSKDTKKITNIKINSSNIENLDVTSEQQIQQFQNFDPKINQHVDQQIPQDNKLNQQADLLIPQDNKINQSLKSHHRNSSNDLKQLSKSDFTILEAEGSDLIQNVNDKMNSSTNKKEDLSQQKINSVSSLGFIKQNSNKKNSLDINNNQVKFCFFNFQDESSKKKFSILNSGSQNNNFIQNQENNKEEYKSILQNLEIQREEDILDNSTTTYRNAQSPRKKNNQSIHHLLIQLRAQKAQQDDNNIPKLFSEVNNFAHALSLLQGQGLSPQRKHNSHKKSLKSSTSIDCDLHSPDHKRTHFRKQTTKAKQGVTIDPNIANLNILKEEQEHLKSHAQKKKFASLRFITEKKNENIFEEKRNQDFMDGGQNEQIVQMNTQYLMNYIQIMQDNQLISPLLDKRMSQMDINKRYTNNNMSKGAGSTFGSFSEQELISPGIKKRQKEKKLSQKNKFSIHMVASAIKKNEQIDQEKIKQIQSMSQLNIQFPVNEDIIRRHSNELDIDLLIYRKNWRLQMLKNQQMNQMYIDEDNEIDIDVAKSYKIYFPKGNLEKVLMKYNKRQISIIKKINQHRNTRISKQFINPKQLHQSRVSVINLKSQVNVKKN